MAHFQGMSEEELGSQVEAALHDCNILDPNEHPEWIPVTSHAPTACQSVNSSFGELNGPKNRRKWTLRTGSGWVTIFGSKAFSEGIHYWEIKIVQQDYFMFGLCFPPDPTLLNTCCNFYHLGSASIPVLKDYSIGFYLQQVDCYAYSQDANRGNKIDLDSDHNGAKLGLLLNLVKGEFILYYFAKNNVTNRPDKVCLLCTLMSGVKYIPAFSLHSATGVYELETSARPPAIISDYVSKVQKLFMLLQEYRARIASMQEANAGNQSEITRLRRAYESLRVQLNANLDI